MVEKQIFSVKWIRSTQISWFNPIHLWNKPMIMNPQSQIIAKKKFNISKHPVFIVSLFPFLMAQIETLCWWQNQSPKSNQSSHQHISSSTFVTNIAEARLNCNLWIIQKLIFRWARRWQNWCFTRLLSITNNHADTSQSANEP